MYTRVTIAKPSPSYRYTNVSGCMAYACRCCYPGQPLYVRCRHLDRRSLMFCTEIRKAFIFKPRLRLWRRTSTRRERTQSKLLFKVNIMRMLKSSKLTHSRRQWLKVAFGSVWLQSCSFFVPKSVGSIHSGSKKI